jgi:phosphate starvation-inducible PhoH-like protein
MAKKKAFKKFNNKNMEEELEEYENLKYDKTYYECYDNLSYREKMLFDEKFSKPRNKSQAKYLRELNNKLNKIILVTGPAGTGKTLLGVEYAIRDFLLANCEKIIFTRPSVSVDEELGFLPGTLEDKMAPWIRPIYDILYKFVNPLEVIKMIKDKQIEICPLGFMRGRTFKNCWIIADEMQNSTPSQMKMLLTRLGESSRLIITGDLEQHDRGDATNGIVDFLDKFKGKRSDSIKSIEFCKDDIEREEIVKEVLEIYSGNIPIMYNEYMFDSIDEEINSN